MNQPSIIYKKLNRLEEELQRLKMEAYFALPQRQPRTRYSEKQLFKALQTTRKDIWQKRYAKKIARLS